MRSVVKIFSHFILQYLNVYVMTPFAFFKAFTCLEKDGS